MDYKYLLSHTDQEEKGSINNISSKAVVPNSGLGSLNSYKKHDDIFDFKTNFRNTQIKKSVPTRKIIQETNNQFSQR